MNSAPTPEKSRSAKKELEHVQIQEGENGGHVVTHHFKGYEHKPEIHAFGPGATQAVVALPAGHPLQHIAKAMGMAHKAMETENFSDFKNAENKRAIDRKKNG